MRENQHEYKDEKVVQSPKDKNKNNSFYKTLLNKNINDNSNKSNNKSKKGDNKSVTSFFKAPLPPTYSFTKSRRKSHMFLNWITCGTANTDEKSVVVINKRKGAVSSVSENNMGQFCKERKLRGVDVKSGSKSSRQEDSNSIKTSGAAYKPVNGPNCSQCGRQFNPEKLHNHMKYCRGMKALAKSTNSRPKPKTSRRPYSPSSESLETFLLDI